jgi:DNA-3-methyladenine glycosylase I
MASMLRRRGFAFVGPVTCHALMQATGMVDDHLVGCFRRGACSSDRNGGPRWTV